MKMTKLDYLKAGLGAVVALVYVAAIVIGLQFVAS